MAINFDSIKVNGIQGSAVPQIASVDNDDRAGNPDLSGPIDLTYSLTGEDLDFGDGIDIGDIGDDYSPPPVPSLAANVLNRLEALRADPIYPSPGLLGSILARIGTAIRTGR